MAICDLSKVAKAKRRESCLEKMFIGYKQTRSVTWEMLAEACGESRQTLQNRFNSGILNLWEWLILLNEVGMPQDEVMEVLKYEEVKRWA